MKYLLTIGALTALVAMLFATTSWGGGINCTSTRVGNTTYTTCR